MESRLTISPPLRRASSRPSEPLLQPVHQMMKVILVSIVDGTFRSRRHAACAGSTAPIFLIRGLNKSRPVGSPRGFWRFDVLRVPLDPVYKKPESL